MAAKGNRRENLKIVLSNWFYRRMTPDQQLAVELGWRPDGETYFEPDLLLLPSRHKLVSKIPAPDVLLLVEVANSSFKYDTQTKAPLYAALGVRETWVINAATMMSRVYRQPSPNGYSNIAEFRQDELMTPHLVPAIALRLRDLGLDGE